MQFLQMVLAPAIALFYLGFFESCAIMTSINDIKAAQGGLRAQLEACDVAEMRLQNTVLVRQSPVRETLQSSISFYRETLEEQLTSHHDYCKTPS